MQSTERYKEIQRVHGYQTVHTCSNTYMSHICHIYVVFVDFQLHLKTASILVVSCGRQGHWMEMEILKKGASDEMDMRRLSSEIQVHHGVSK